jgi:hypothetical protein
MPAVFAAIVDAATGTPDGGAAGGVRVDAAAQAAANSATAGRAKIDLIVWSGLGTGDYPTRIESAQGMGILALVSIWRVGIR